MTGHCALCGLEGGLLCRSGCGVSFGWILAGEDFGEEHKHIGQFLSRENVRCGPRGIMILLSHHNIGLGCMPGMTWTTLSGVVGAEGDPALLHEG